MSQDKDEEKKEFHQGQKGKGKERKSQVIFRKKSAKKETQRQREEVCQEGEKKGGGFPEEQGIKRTFQEEDQDLRYDQEGEGTVEKKDIEEIHRQIGEEVDQDKGKKEGKALPRGKEEERQLQ